MPSTEKKDYAHIADYLIKNARSPNGETAPEGKPMAHALRFDGSLSVVAANGQKFIFTPAQIAQAEADLKTLEKPVRKSTRKAPIATKTAPNAKKVG